MLARGRGRVGVVAFIAVAMGGLQVMEGNENGKKVTLTRENLIILPSTPVVYSLGDESLDGLCTSLDGPLCKAEDKARALAAERARIGHHKSSPAQNTDAQKPTGAAAPHGQKKNTVQTTKEFKFQGGKEVGGKVETRVKGGDKDSHGVRIMAVDVGEGDDIDDVVNKMQQEIAAALSALGLEDDGDFVEDGRRDRNGRTDGGQPAAVRQQRQHRHLAANSPLLQDVRDCQLSSSGAGKDAEASVGGFKEGSVGDGGVCKLKGLLYRCTKLEGNALAPNGPAAGAKSPASDSEGGTSEGTRGNSEGKNRGHAGTTSAAGGCLSQEESVGECGAGEVLCQVSSAASLAEFSSPQPCWFDHKVGFVPDDPREDIFIADMTWAQAREWCDANEECAAFTFASPHEKPVKPVTVWFKRISFVDGNGRGWHTFLKKCSRPDSSRFSYLDALPAPALQWLQEELMQQLSYSQDLLAERSISSDKAAGAHDDTDIGVRGGFGLGNMINMVNLNLDRINSVDDAMRAVTKAMHKLGLSKTKEELRNMAMAAFHAAEQLKRTRKQGGAWGSKGPKEALAAELKRERESIRVGDKVSARWKAKEYFLGTVKADNGDGTFAIAFEDGDFDAKVPRAHIQSRSALANRNAQHNPNDVVTDTLKSIKKGHMDPKALIKALAQTKPPNGVKRILEAMERSLNATATKTQSK